MADSKPVKKEVNGTVILPPFVFPGIGVCIYSLQARVFLRRVRQLRLAFRRDSDGRAEELRRPPRRPVGVVDALQSRQHSRHHHRRHRHHRPHRHLLHRVQQVGFKPDDFFYPHGDAVKAE